MIFKVPQFIEVEDKIFGPFTFKQFVYLVGGAGAAFVLWNLVPAFLPSFLGKFVAIVLIGIIAGLALALAFWQYNKRPFVILLESMFKYVIGGRLYVWKPKERKKKQQAKAQEKKSSEPYRKLEVPTLSGNRLKDLAWSLDIKENTNRPGS